MGEAKAKRGSWRRRLLVALVIVCVLAAALPVLGWTFFSVTSRGFAAFAHTVYPGAVFRIPVDEKLIALTMDDGPSPEYTGPILDVLKEHGAKATFFFISDHVPGNEALVRRVVDEGHELAHHMKTERMSVSLPPDEFTASFDEAERVLSAFQPLRWYRPGSGFYDDRMIEYAESKGYSVALGNLFPFDTNIDSVDFATDFILRGAHPGAIIVLHDGGDRGRRCVETLKRIIPALHERGYTFVTLTELAAAAAK